ncbi:MAG: hypothetical protein PUP91_37715 [Rhizonema sp. PD37]|nr:hypothetical protein [Rhizonema sp. PD37]
MYAAENSPLSGNFSVKTVLQYRDNAFVLLIVNSEPLVLPPLIRAVQQEGFGTKASAHPIFIRSGMTGNGKFDFTD